MTDKKKCPCGGEYEDDPIVDIEFWTSAHPKPVSLFNKGMQASGLMRCTTCMPDFRSIVQSFMTLPPMAAAIDGINWHWAIVRWRSGRVSGRVFKSLLNPLRNGN